MASRTYLTRDGEVLDAIARRVYGTEKAVHAMITANPHITHLPPELPGGITLILPDLPPAAPQAQTVRLW